MYATHIPLLLAWIGYGVLHSVFASVILKQWLKKRWAGYNTYYRLWYTVFAVLSLAALLWFQCSIDSVMLFDSAFVKYAAGLPLGLGGLVIMLICSRYHLLHLLGLDTLIKKNNTQGLKINGLYSWIRHPLYLGTFMFITGLFFSFPLLSNLLSILAIMGYTLTAIPLEEKKLLAEFGEQYLDYKRKVPMILPFT
ncbi:MAG: isoprenylcysteine carboxylmethyltransferase family protein [Chitinophagaceae bacterium]